MNIKKNINNKLLMLFTFLIIIFGCTFIYIKNKKCTDGNNFVEEAMEDNVANEYTTKTINMKEASNDEILTEIGQQELLVDSYYGDVYDTTKEANKEMFGEDGNFVKEKWVSVKPKKEYIIGVLLPHFEDTYWITVGYGIINYAKELGVKIKLYSVGGYIELGNQKEKLQMLGKDSNIDGIILGTLDYTKLDDDVEKIIDSGKPIIEISNNIYTSKISAKSVVSYYKMGYKAGESVIKDSGEKDIKIAFFPGPDGSGWALDSYRGFRDAISKLKKEHQKIDISTPFYGDTRPNVQRLRIVSVLEKSNYDYVVGCAPAVVQAEKYIAEHKEKFSDTKIVSTYITSEVYDLINKGTVLAAPSDQTIQECRIALDMTVRTLNGERPGRDFPFQSGPEPPIISKDNISQFKYEDLFGNRDYVPVLNDTGE